MSTVRGGCAESAGWVSDFYHTGEALSHMNAARAAGRGCIAYSTGRGETGWMLPGVGNDGPCLFYGDLPDSKHLCVAALVAAGEVSIAEPRAHCRRALLSQHDHIHGCFLPIRRDTTSQARPGGISECV